MYKHFFKRIFDFIVSLTAIICLCPIFLAMIVGLYFANKDAGIFFVQKRPGRNSKIFNVIKFKTMVDKYDDNGNPLPDAQRLTRIGRFVRTTSLDELPQLINVLKGDMSMIGPRPLLVQYLPLYSKEQARRHEVTPGITGWAQVNGRNAISWKQKFEYDVWYVDNLNFSLDLKILYMTFKNVLMRKGINSDTSATMEAFTGNQIQSENRM